MLVGMTVMLRIAVALLACSALAACSGAGNTTPCGPIAVTAVPPPSLIAPARGSTGVPTTVGDVAISYNPPSGALHLVAQDTGAVIFGGPLVGATGSVNLGPGAVVSAVPTLAPHTTYTVFVDAVIPQVPCFGGGPTTYNLGTFTTQ
jgi:hypothetical protein